MAPGQWPTSSRPSWRPAATARWIPPGGSEPIGTLGYVAAGLELAAQATGAGLTPTDVVVATSTGGT